MANPINNSRLWLEPYLLEALMTVLKWITYLLLLLASAACVPNQQGSVVNTPTAASILPVDAATPTGEAVLITYNNATYGYMFEYPSHRRLDDSISGFVTIDQRIDIFVFEDNPEIFNERLVIETADDMMMGVNNTRLLKGRYTVQHGVTPVRIQAFVIQNDGRYFVFVAHAVKQDVAETVDLTQVDVPAATVALLEQVVASLRFTT